MTDLVAITGMGCISAAGQDVSGHCAGLKETRRFCSISPLLDASLPYPVFHIGDPALATTADEMRVARLALRAAQEALESAGLLNAIPPSVRFGVFLGSTTACQLNDLEFHRALRASGSFQPEAPSRYFSGHLAEHVAARLNLPAGPRWVVANACASGTDAIGMAFMAIRNGLCDMAIAGGADELTTVSLAGFHSLGVASPEPCLPFDRDRKGLNLGEGAGVMVLERADAAVARDRKPALHVLGYGCASDAYHMTAPHPDGIGLEKAVVEALKMARIEPADIAFVNAHGTATPDNDRVEGQTLVRIFGEHVVAVSTKGYTGHTLGAAGGIEAVFTALGLREGWIPANIGFSSQDPDIPFRPPHEPQAVRGRCALSTSLAFGGNNAALVIGSGAPEELPTR